VINKKNFILFYFFAICFSFFCFFNFVFSHWSHSLYFKVFFMVRTNLSMQLFALNFRSKAKLSNIKHIIFAMFHPHSFFCVVFVSDVCFRFLITISPSFCVCKSALDSIAILICNVIISRNAIHVFQQHLLCFHLMGLFNFDTCAFCLFY